MIASAETMVSAMPPFNRERFKKPYLRSVATWSKDRSVQQKDPVAERVGFEPTVPCGTTVFETVPIDHSGTSPHWEFRTFVHCLDGAGAGRRRRL